jgi:hypothetical protein
MLASAAIAPSIKPIATNDALARRSFFIVLPQVVDTGAERSCGFVNHCRDVSIAGQIKSMRLSAAIHK